ncbi:hypothetical protein HYDPIDRAFT_33053 [Hydnomerulius pinastri MD-312]|uniref:Unplaced genomic scaffold scaffold_50, whole genome shotgun sequence n=1 Tax=Hydnomerulius pinastri MD-312 TaxID=994086 RepID=A0A0C9W168_9AGAM|nr:hypothetical protein HYDPIDRAFT_33053 [Hydnomerulius pinastri MD-312]
MTTIQAQIDTLLLKSLLGEELIHTQFYLFSSRSKKKETVRKPRVLCVNNTIVTQSSPYFTKLLATDEEASDATIFEFPEGHGLYDEMPFGDYGYEDDSDLDDEVDDERNAIGKPEKLLGGGSGAQLSGFGGAKPSLQAPVDSDDIAASIVISSPLRHIKSRYILVKDTAFRTWKALLFYLYTGRVVFCDLRSQGRASPAALDSTSEPPRCSAKSMYRLARKVGCERLEVKALDAIRERLSMDNIIPELGLVLPSRSACCSLS